MQHTLQNNRQHPVGTARDGRPPASPNARPLLAAAALGLLLAAGGALTGPLNAQSTPTRTDDAFAGLPATLTLEAVVRDFRGKDQPGGHPDFQAFTGEVRTGLLNDRLGADGKPTLRSLAGTQLNAPFTDRTGRAISPLFFDAAKGDRAGRTEPRTDARITSQASFHSWYRDTAGVNLTKTVPLTLKRQPGTNRYVFDSATDAPYAARGGFFPINGELLGNYANNSRGVNSNFHFTTEVQTTFVFERGTGQVFTFTGDDDVWVFIDGRLVIDLGGLHPRREQSIELDRLSWLQSGRKYPLAIFHAERRTNESNFRVETTIRLEPVPRPANSALQD